MYYFVVLERGAPYNDKKSLVVVVESKVLDTKTFYELCTQIEKSIDVDYYTVLDFKLLE